MRAADNVLEEALSVLELSALCTYPLQPLFDNLGAASFVTVEHEPYLGKTHTNALAGLNDT